MQWGTFCHFSLTFLLVIKKPGKKISPNLWTSLHVNMLKVKCIALEINPPGCSTPNLRSRSFTFSLFSCSFARSLLYVNLKLKVGTFLPKSCCFHETSPALARRVHVTCWTCVDMRDTFLDPSAISQRLYLNSAFEALPSAVDAFAQPSWQQHFLGSLWSFCVGGSGGHWQLL